MGIMIAITAEQFGKSWVPYADLMCGTWLFCAHELILESTTVDRYVLRDEYGHLWTSRNDTEGERLYQCDEYAMRDVLTRAGWPHDAITNMIRYGLGWSELTYMAASYAQELETYKYIQKYLNDEITWYDVVMWLPMLTEESVRTGTYEYRRDAKDYRTTD